MPIPARARKIMAAAKARGYVPKFDPTDEPECEDDQVTFGPYHAQLCEDGKVGLMEETTDAAGHLVFCCRLPDVPYGYGSVAAVVRVIGSLPRPS